MKTFVNKIEVEDKFICINVAFEDDELDPALTCTVYVFLEKEDGLTLGPVKIAALQKAHDFLRQILEARSTLDLQRSF